MIFYEIWEWGECQRDDDEETEDREITMEIKMKWDGARGSGGDGEKKIVTKKKWRLFINKATRHALNRFVLQWYCMRVQALSS